MRGIVSVSARRRRAGLGVATAVVCLAGTTMLSGGAVAGATPASTSSSTGPSAARVDWRTADITDSLNADGTHTAELSSVSVNYRRPDGSWASIDNTLVTDAATGSVVNRGNSWQVRFGSDAPSVTLIDSGRTTTMRPVGGAAVRAQVHGSSVVYRGVWPGADLQYSVDSTGITESVLLTKPGALGRYSFAVAQTAKAGVVRPVLQVRSDGSVAGVRSGVAFSAPAVVRADGAAVPAAKAKLSVPAAGTVQVGVDQDWLARQPASAYPIDIDPSISLAYTTAHSYKSDGYTCTNCGIQFGNARDDGNTYWRSVAHFGYEKLFGDTVTAASFAVKYAAGTTNAYSIAVHHASALSYAGAAYGAVLASGSISSGKVSGSALTSTLASWVKNRTSGAYFGFLGNQTASLYTYQKDTFTLTITYTVPAPVTVPGAPRTVSASAGDASAAVHFSAPASNGGSAITSYKVTASPGGRTATGAGSPLTVTGLTNGTAYTFKVTATNKVGTGPASAASAPVTPTAPVSGGGTPIPNQAKGWDAEDSVSADAVSCMKSAGYTFDMLYTNFDNDWQTTYKALAANGMHAVLQQGFGSNLFDPPSAGTTTGQANVKSAQAVNYPKGADFFIDVESTDPATESSLIQWINNWADQISAAGYVPAVYLGVPTALQPSDLNATTLPKIKVYWQSISSSAPDPAQGYVVVQGSGSTSCISSIDTDTAYIDNNGNHLIGS